MIVAFVVSSKLEMVFDDMPNANQAEGNQYGSAEGTDRLACVRIPDSVANKSGPNQQAGQTSSQF